MTNLPTYLPDKGRPQLVLLMEHRRCDRFELAEFPGKVRPLTTLLVLLPKEFQI